LGRTKAFYVAIRSKALVYLTIIYILFFPYERQVAKNCTFLVKLLNSPTVYESPKGVNKKGLTDLGWRLWSLAVVLLWASDRTEGRSATSNIFEQQL
jgi:hypothetical protein